MSSELQTRLDAYWNARAADYHRAHVTSARAQLDHELWSSVFATRLPPAPARILDCGTGSGYLARILTAQGHEVVGVDSSSGMLTQARAAGTQAELVQGDVVDPPVRGLFDAAVSRFVLWTLRDPEQAVASWARLVCPGGNVVCVDATWFPEGTVGGLKVDSEGGPDAFARAYDEPTLARLPLACVTSPDAFAHVFESAGLRDVRVTALPEVQALDRACGTAPGHESRPHFVIRGTR